MTLNNGQKKSLPEPNTLRKPTLFIDLQRVGGWEKLLHCMQETETKFHDKCEKWYLIYFVPSWSHSVWENFISCLSCKLCLQEKHFLVHWYLAANFFIPSIFFSYQIHVQFNMCGGKFSSTYSMIRASSKQLYLHKCSPTQSQLEGGICYSSLTYSLRQNILILQQ